MSNNYILVSRKPFVYVRGTQHACRSRRGEPEPATCSVPAGCFCRFCQIFIHEKSVPREIRVWKPPQIMNKLTLYYMIKCTLSVFGI